MSRTLSRPGPARSVMARSSALDYSSNELVVGLVSPVGTDLTAIERNLRDHFLKFKYDVKRIRLSSFLERLDLSDFEVRLKSAPEYDRIRTRMDAGNALRESTKRGDLLALHAASEIAALRTRDSNGPEPLHRTVHLLDSLKNPEEVTVLRKIYGPGFYLVALYSPESDRLAFLRKHKDLTSRQAQTLIERDQAETSPLGQQTRETFHLADVFVPAGSEGTDRLWRFIDLVFGHPFHTPTPDEHAMFLAYAASLRSADLSRQVGAVVVSEAGEVIATGANDVPRAGGGLYWPEPTESDQRDFRRGFDSNRRQIRDIAEDTVHRVLDPDVPSPMPDDLHRRLKPGRLYDLTEFGRAVHAEMEALTACARVGVTPRRGTLYTTTFPCHNCAKHIIAAGISRVVYVEPYPKSQAFTLHDDAIALEERDGSIGSSVVGSTDARVRFTPFTGIGPRRYFELFSTRLGGGDRKIRAVDGQAVSWRPAHARPRIGMSPASYLIRERLAISELRQIPAPGSRRKRGHHGRT